MLGFYDWSMYLTYLSLLSAGFGIIVSMNGSGHPYIGAFCLLFCGLCDAFDGKVASMKKDRTETQKKFGIQVDSLSDLLAFGMLPASIGVAMLRVSPAIVDPPHIDLHDLPGTFVSLFFTVVMLLYVLAAMIRLAYFNVMEEERQKKESGRRKAYEGLPVTSAALIFPTILLFQYFIPKDITIVYFIVMILTGFAFLTRFKITKPGMRGILIMVAIGALEGILLFVSRYYMLMHGGM